MRRREALVVAAHAERARQLGVLDITPALEPLVPVIGQLERVVALLGEKPRTRSHECGDRRRKREGTDAGILLPAVLRAHRAAAGEEAHGGAHHLPSARKLRLAQLGELGREQHRQRHLIELDAVPVGLAAREVVLRPVSSGPLRGNEMRENLPGVEPLVGGEQREGREAGVARPYEVIPAERFGAVTPRHRQARDDRTRVGAILVDLQHRRRELRRIAQRLIGTRQAQSRSPPMPGLDEGAAQRIEVCGEGRSGACVGTGGAVGEPQREHAMVPARLAADRDRTVARRLKLIGERAVAVQVLAAVRGSHEPAAQMLERNACGETD